MMTPNGYQSANHYEELLPEARAVSTSMALELVKIGNEKEGARPTQFAVLASAMVVQTILSSLALQLFSAQDKKAFEWIDMMYAGFAQDTKDRWMKTDMVAAERWQGEQP